MISLYRHHYFARTYYRKYLWIFHSCNKITLFIIIACILLKKEWKKNGFAYLALAFKVVWHTPFNTFKGGDPINALITILSYSNFFLLDFISESFG